MGASPRCRSQIELIADEIVAPGYGSAEDPTETSIALWAPPKGLSSSICRRRTVTSACDTDDRSDSPSSTADVLSTEATAICIGEQPGASVKGAGMVRAKTSARWEILGGINVDAAAVGFGDPAVLGDWFIINGYRSDIEIIEDYRKSLVFQSTGENGPCRWKW